MQISAYPPRRPVRGPAERRRQISQDDQGPGRALCHGCSKREVEMFSISSRRESTAQPGPLRSLREPLSFSDELIELEARQRSSTSEVFTFPCIPCAMRIPTPQLQQDHQRRMVTATFSKVISSNVFNSCTQRPSTRFSVQPESRSVPSTLTPEP